MSKQILPSRMNLALFKQKKIGAKKGYDLLKKKSDALKKAFRDIMIKILEIKKRIGKDYNQCLLTLAKANFEPTLSKANEDHKLVTELSIGYEGMRQKVDTLLYESTKFQKKTVTMNEFHLRAAELVSLIGV